MAISALKPLWEVGHILEPAVGTCGFAIYIASLCWIWLSKSYLVLTVHAMNGVVFFTLFVGNFLLENFCWKREGREEKREGRGRGSGERIARGGMGGGRIGERNNKGGREGNREGS